MTIPPMNIYENQARSIGTHNLSKFFTPNLNTVRVLPLGTKFNSKWKFKKRKMRSYILMTLQDGCTIKYTLNLNLGCRKETLGLKLKPIFKWKFNTKK